MSYNLFDIVLKVKNRMGVWYRMAVSVLVVHTCDHVAAWELWLTAPPSIMREDQTSYH